MIEVGSDPTQAGGFFFRIGPHFDFLTGGVYKDDRLVGYSGYNDAEGIDLKAQTALWTPSSDKKTATKSSTMADIYNSFVLGVTLEMGGQIRLTDYLKLIVTLHLETSLTNPEAQGAASFANNLREQVTTLGGAIGDGAKLLSEATPFDASYPNYINNDQIGATHRDPAWNVMGGLTIGAIYTLDFGN